MAKSNLDKFYTKKEIAKKLIQEIDIKNFDIIIEPSAGNGSFSDEINNCIAYDIEPENENIIKKDFFEVEIDIKNKNTLIIGNPPFGKRSYLAKKFIKKSIDIGSDTIAFILPNTFYKKSNQNIFPKEWVLEKIINLGDSSFYLTEDKEYFVPCSFFVWTKNSNKKNLRKEEQEKTNDFIFCKRGDLNADFSINGNTGIVKEIKDITNPKAEHYIKSGEKTKGELIKIFKNLKYPGYSSVNGGNFWIGQTEILEVYNDSIKNNK